MLQNEPGSDTAGFSRFLRFRHRPEGSLGRALGHFIFSLVGLKRILFTNIFLKLEKPHLVLARQSLGVRALNTLTGHETSLESIDRCSNTSIVPLHMGTLTPLGH